LPDPTHETDRRRRRFLLAIAGCALAMATVVVAGGGFTASFAGVLFQVHRPWPLLGAALLAAAAAGVAAARSGGIGTLLCDAQAAWAGRTRVAPWIAACAAAAALIVGLVWGTWSAGSADAYGYVSQALSWTRGELRSQQPLAAAVPWRDAEWTLSPLGYRPATTPGTIVPTYPPGLPLSMAAAATMAGPSAVFWIVPFAGAAAVWLTFLLGRRIAGDAGGATAAVLLAASPVFLYQLVQPMSDVPVTAWWLGAVLCVATGRPALAGTCAAAAVLTRPNLAPLAAWALVGVLGHVRASRTWTSRVRHGAIFAIPVTAALAFLAALHTHWYGHPFATGYGAAGGLFSAANIPTNTRHYLGWLSETQTPLVYLALAAPAMAWLGRGSAGASAENRTRPALTVFSLGFVLLVLASYLPYSPFDEWWYLRFLLPALPLLLILTSGVLLGLAERIPAWLRVPVVALALTALATHYVATARDRQTFELHELESRYVAAGTYAARRLPAAAVLLSVQESGSLRLYGGRTTIRFDHLDPQGLDAAVHYLQQTGYQPYFALEAWEETQFRDRFSRASGLGRLDWPPVAEVGHPVKVRFYDPRDRQRFLDGDTVTTFKEPNASGR
jgi:hypothetical protein